MFCCRCAGTIGTFCQWITGWKVGSHGRTISKRSDRCRVNLSRWKWTTTTLVWRPAGPTQPALQLRRKLRRKSASNVKPASGTASGAYSTGSASGAVTIPTNPRTSLQITRRILDRIHLHGSRVSLRYAASNPARRMSTEGRPEPNTAIFHPVNSLLACCPEVPRHVRLSSRSPLESPTTAFGCLQHPTRPTTTNCRDFNSRHFNLRWDQCRL